MVGKSVEKVITERDFQGIKVVVERLADRRSASFTMIFPGGFVHEPQDKLGASGMLAEILSRGAGQLSAKELSIEFEKIGASHRESAGNTYFVLSATALGENIAGALELSLLMAYSAVIPEEEIEPIRELFIQDIRSIFDNPARRVHRELHRLFIPPPYNRHVNGEIETLKEIKREDLQQLFNRFFPKQGSIISIAGGIDCEQIVNFVENQLSQYNDKDVRNLQQPDFGECNVGRFWHIPSESAQEHIAMAMPYPKLTDEEYFHAIVLESVISGGMFGRLFVEVREKRGLCYAVRATYSSDSLHGTLSIYAGTTPERAQETLDTIIYELNKLKGSITEDELAMAKTEAKAGLIMRGESASAVAQRNASQLWWRRKIVPLEDLIAGIEQVTVEDLDRLIDKYPFSNMSVVALGKKELKFTSK